jgi:dTDP-4-amino-4,6-dideoxygalactose transaminase
MFLFCFVLIYAGADVDFVDIDANTFLIDLQKLEDKLKQNKKGTYKAVIPVDFAGYPVNVEDLKTLSKKYDFKIIEDACHAPGGYFKNSANEKILCGNGKYSDLSIFSFHPVKHIAAGEGGMITTNSKELFERLQTLRTHGITKNPAILEENHGNWYYEMHELGYNYRITDFQAALGQSQLNRANEGLKIRNKIAKKYNHAFANTKIITPKIAKNIFHAYHLYIIQTENRKELYDYLRENNIFAQVHYIPVHLHPYFKKKFGFKKGDFPISEKYYEKALSLPMFPTLTEKEQDFVIEKTINFFK